MRTQSSDTHPDIERVQIEMLRKLGEAGRVKLARSLSRSALRLSWRALEEANPGASEEELKVLFVALNYGPDIAEGFRTYLKNRRGQDSAA